MKRNLSPDRISETGIKKNKNSRSLVYSIVITNCVSFCSQIDVLTTALEDIRLYIVKNERMTTCDIVDDEKIPFTGIVYQEIDSTRIAAAIGRYQCDNIDISEDATENDRCISVNLKSFLKNLKNIPSEYTVELKKYSDQEKLIIKAFSVDTRHVRYSSINLIDIDSEKMNFDQWPSTWIIEVSFFDFIKAAKNLDSKFVRLRIFKHLTAPSSILYFVLQAHGIDSSVEDTFVSQTQSNNIIVKNDELCCFGEYAPHNTSICDVKPLLDSCFSLTYLHNFLKATERKRVILRLGKQNSHPLLLYSSFGNRSYTAFVLAAKETDGLNYTDTIDSFKN
jgi:hypothetical protein